MQSFDWQSALGGFTSPTGLVIGSPLRPTGQRGFQFQNFEHPSGPLVLLAAWGLLLARYNGDDAVLIGAGSRKGDGGAMLPLPVRIRPKEAAQDYLARVRSDYEAIWRDPPAIEALRTWSGMAPDAPLFESAVLFQDRETGLPLTLFANARSICARYDAAYFEADAIGRLLGHLGSLLDTFENQPRMPVREAPLLTENERGRILVAWNDTAVEFPHEATLHGLFEAQAASRPEKTALVWQDRSITYGELNSQANRLAHHLVGLGVGPDIPVAVFMERSLEMGVALYGILKAGGCYVPVDPEYPAERVGFMLADTRPPVVLTQDRLLPALNGLDVGTGAIVRIDGDAAAIAAHPPSNPETGVSAGNLAYIIYTSGSTGNPKGAMLNHRGRVNNFLDFNRRYHIGGTDTLLGLSSLSFDMSAYDIFGMLAAGGTTVIVEAGARLQPARWAERMRRHGVTVWHSVPALLEMLVSHLEARPDRLPGGLRLTLLGGDWIPVNLPDRARALFPGVHNVSMGGATECSMDSTIYDIVEPSSGWKSIPYGVPMANQRCYVLDAAMQPVPVGVPGELFLGGVGVGEGYFNRPALTAEKFLDNPFVPGEHLYRTGDLARYMPDGNLELLGRVDFQVKIRGYRVELGEIEAALRAHPAVEEAVVLARQDPGAGRRLVAYLKQDPAYLGTPEELQAWHDDQVARWQLVYDTAYLQPSDEQDSTFNIVSWDSSYTGRPIPAGEMRQWVDSTVERILRHRPQRVFEIGCGTGLLLFRIAPHTDHYLGSDFSGVALDYVRRNLGDLEGVVRLERRMADDFEGIAPASFDCVVLNSIVLDFPSVEYLLAVLAGAARAVAPGGVIFVGDVRALALAGAYHSSVQLARAPASLDSEALQQRITKGLRLEEELLIDPGFFAALPDWVPGISAAEIHLKAGDYDNELSRFRYDVTLHVGDSERKDAGRPSIEWLAWGLDLDSVEHLRRALEKAGAGLGVRGVPNALLAPHVALEALIPSASEPVEALRARLERLKSEPDIPPALLWAIGAEMGKHANLQYGEEPHLIDALFFPGDGVAPIFPHGIQVEPASRPGDFTNNPLQGKLARSLLPDIRRRLESSLPDYMVPSAFVWLDAFPLNPNGKINRMAFPAPDSERPELGEAFIAPRNPIETVLAEIWAQGLGLESVGVNDRFIALGGHSLLATQVVSRIRDIFQVELPLSYGFNATIAELAQKLSDAGEEIGVDMQMVADVFLEINQLTDEEAQALLEAEG